MNIVKTVAELRAARAALPEPVGLVPTMGFLHEGHLALARAAREQNASVVASIFVNPKQFGPSEDLASYPRDLDRDLKRLDAAGVDLVFVPPTEEIYPPGFNTVVDVGPLGEVLEGARRPGHFRGVATVVARLFALIGPGRAYFGQKDAQQCVVIKKMTAEIGFPIEIVVIPIVREPDGLALSSRNVYLTSEQRVAARVLSASLRAVSQRYESGERDANLLGGLVRDLIDAEPLASLDYVSVADAATLDDLDRVDRPALVSLAARVGRARLIDNILLG
ncbi:MAG: pantoate--beta-alanine ligase [Chloroflexota bacterium]